MILIPPLTRRDFFGFLMIGQSLLALEFIRWLNPWAILFSGIFRLKQCANHRSQIAWTLSLPIRGGKFSRPSRNQSLPVFGGKPDSLLTLFRPKNRRRFVVHCPRVTFLTRCYPYLIPLEFFFIQIVLHQ